jgi:hypothetical protein
VDGRDRATPRGRRLTTQPAQGAIEDLEVEEPVQTGRPAIPTTRTDLISPPKSPKPNQLGGSGLNYAVLDPGEAA